MIAFNELLVNLSEYEENFKRRGYSISLSNFVVLEDKRKIVQLKAENLRAETNKLCASIAALKRQNSDTSITLRQINKNEKTLKTLNKKLSRMGKAIDSKLEKLPNLTEFNNISNIEIETSNKPSELKDLKTFINSKFNQSTSDLTIQKYVKSLKGRLFQEKELGLATHCKNGITLLFQNYKANEIKNELLKYIKNNSLNLIQTSIKTFAKSSSCEYLAELNDFTWIKLENKGEYFTRAHKIKYRNIQIDATKFVYEIDILFNKK